MERKDEKILAFYSNTLLAKGRPPTLREIAIEEDISRQRANFYIKRLEEDGKLKQFLFKKNQRILLPINWIEKYPK